VLLFLGGMTYYNKNMTLCYGKETDQPTQHCAYAVFDYFLGKLIRGC
jgi:hypothetical protein